ncbi:unnamed protein product [Protopolystoma xenopodis]|uniref:Uncharacterized protein n=1 Tax=Protopolystoma xenopodis TaxID=117903 RepID=A0A3S4ZY03_9PLAT|nr:unnamed protein product [Protopolystoma xenopodis]
MSLCLQSRLTFSDSDADGRSAQLARRRQTTIGATGLFTSSNEVSAVSHSNLVGRENEITKAPVVEPKRFGIAGEWLEDQGLLDLQHTKPWRLNS